MSAYDHLLQSGSFQNLEGNDDRHNPTSSVTAISAVSQ